MAHFPEGHSAIIESYPRINPGDSWLTPRDPPSEDQV